MKNIGVIIQARLSSKRYPRKMIKKISNISIIEWVIKRVKKTTKASAIILATTNEKIDNTLVEIAKKNKIFFFRGKKDDVLDRFYEAAKVNNLNIIVRVCGDNPFIDPEQIDLLISKFLLKKYDYGFNHQDKLNSNYADGFGAEILYFSILKKIHNISRNKFHREHVTKYIWDNIKKFKILAIPDRLAFPKLKFDVNTKEDLHSIRELVKKNKISLTSSAFDIVNFKLTENKKIKLNKIKLN